MEDPNKPIGVFLLLGPSGVGKTETALALADTLYGGERNLITINMSEYQEAHTVSSLKGSPPGYVGYGEGGVLTEGSTAYPRAAGGLDGAVELDDAATAVTISIADAQGGTLRSLQLGAQAKGTTAFEWDGKDGSGNDVGAGPFTITAFATSGDKTVTSRTLVWAPVESVSLPSSGAPKLKVVGVGDVDPSDVRSAT